MKIVRRVISVIFIAIAAFLVFAVVHAVASTAGANVGVCVGYVVGALVLLVLAVLLWGRRVKASPTASV